MLYATLCRRIREIPDPVDLQRAAFDLHKELLFASFHIEVYARIAICIFRYHPVEVLGFQPLFHHLVRCLAVYIKEDPDVLPDSHQIILCLSVRCPRCGQPYFTSWDQ